MLTPARTALLARAGSAERHAEDLYASAHRLARGGDPIPAARVQAQARLLATEAVRLQALAASKRDIGAVRGLLESGR